MSGWEMAVRSGREVGAKAWVEAAAAAKHKVVKRRVIADGKVLYWM
jgi:hypothetical protein